MEWRAEVSYSDGMNMHFSQFPMRLFWILGFALLSTSGCSDDAGTTPLIAESGDINSSPDAGEAPVRDTPDTDKVEGSKLPETDARAATDPSDVVETAAFAETAMGSDGAEEPPDASPVNDASPLDEDVTEPVDEGSRIPDTIAEEDASDVWDTSMDSDVTPDAVSVYEPPPEWWGDPIATKPDEWAWVEFPDSRCADGSPTGLGINISPGATKALVYFEGGGACWNYATCFGAVQTSFHLSGYDEGSFKGLIAEFYKNSLLLDRENENNPLADAHLVFLPYCTGDAFLGTQVTTLDGPLWAEGDIHFWGRNNVKTYLERLAPTFTGVDHIVISGGSAGGFGAGFNWTLFQEAFPGLRVDVLDDSGPPMNPGDGQWEKWKSAWGPEFPVDCPACEENVSALLDYFREKLLKSGKFALMSYDRDGIISTFFGLFPFQFENRLLELCELLDEEPDAQYFIVPGILHTLTIVASDTIEASDGTPLWWWINQMVNDDPNWKSHKP